MSRSASFPRTLLATALCATLAIALPLGAQAQSTQAAGAAQRYDIPAGPLGETLRRISLQSGLTVSADAALVAGRQASPVRGQLDARDAARQALAGTGLELAVTPSGVLTVRPAPAAPGTTSLAPVLVTATAASSSEATGAYTVPASRTATRLNLSLRETPQSVSVITRQQMEDQGIVNVADALAHAPGIIVNRDNSEGYSFYARGFELQNFQFDGLPSLSSDGGNVRDNYSITNSVIYDRVEVLKGATGLVNGAGYPSGVINLVRKRPTDVFQASVTAGVGSWDRTRGELDLSGPLAANGKVRARLVAASDERDSHLKHADSKERVFYGIVEADLTPRTVATLGLEYQENRNRGTTNSHLPAFFADGRVATFSRSTNPADAWTYRNQDTTRIFADLNHTLGNGWQVRLAGSHRDYASRELIGGMTSGLINLDNSLDHGFYPGGASRFDTDSRENSLDVQVSGPFTLFGRSHDLVLGMNYAKTHAVSNRADGDTDPLIDDVFHWNNNATRPTSYEWWLTHDVNARQRMFYAATVLHPTDRLSLIAGGRLTNYTWSLDSSLGNGRTSSYGTKVSSEFIPYVGLTYDLDGTHTVYASYTDVFKPQAYNFDANNRQLDPLTGKSMELGAKGEYLDGRLNASVALFQLKQDNVAEPDPSGATRPDGGQAYVPVQGVTTRGIELEVSGEVLRNWRVMAGYTYARSRDRNGERVSTTQPQQIFKLATSYRLPGDLHRITVGGGLQWQSGSYFTETIGGQAYRFQQDSYALLNLMAAYDITKDLRLSLNVNNVLDKHYYAGIGNYNTVFYGEPTSVLAQLRYRY
jgi:outer-membrane receptor for ferric coprogen and ferric-rhodotorulic acid